MPFPSLKGAMAKYDPLRAHLESNGDAIVTLAFATISRMVGGLPRSAYDYRAWWSNDRSTPRHVQARAWTGAGYSADPDLANELVQFRKA